MDRNSYRYYQLLADATVSENDDLNDLQVSSIIKNEAGILSRTGGGFHIPSTFAKEHLFYVQWAAEYCCDANYVLDRNFLDCLCLYRVLEGQIEFIYRNRTFTASGGDVVFLDLKEPHKYRALGNLRLQFYIVGGACTQEYFDLLSETRDILFGHNSRLSFVFDSLFSETEQDFPNDHKISFLLHTIFAILTLHIDEQEPVVVTQAKQFINTNYEKPIFLEDIAAHVGLSQYHFSRIFKESTDMSPYDYLIRLRMRHARSLLTDTDLPISEIALACGYSGASHFIRSFKAIHDVTPSYFRKHFDPSGFVL